MTPDEAIRAAQAGNLHPVYLVVGDERYLAEQVIAVLSRQALAGGLPDFNETKLTAGEADLSKVIGAARTAPMMAKRRVVLVRAVERWDTRAPDEESVEEQAEQPAKLSPLDGLADYAANPTPTTCLILLAGKLDGRRKLVALARKGGWLMSCDPLVRGALPGWILHEANARGHAMTQELADLLAELSGPELPNVVDALERVGLYVGEGQPLSEEAIDACVVRMRTSTVWELVSAVGRRDLGTALATLVDVYDPRDRGLRLVAVLARSVRQLIKFEAAQRGGASPEDAARRAGVPPFKARELAAQVRAIPRGELERWLVLLSATDLALKGSRLPPQAILESAMMEMCTGSC